MTFEALSRKGEIRAAFNEFRSALTKGIKPLLRNVGWQGGGGTFNVYRIPSEEYWCVLEPDLTENRYWCAFGTDDPQAKKSLTITCEINSPFAGVDRRVAGVFVRAREGGGIAHSGKIGGGRKGIGQSAFLSECRCAEAPVTFADGLTTEMLIVGALASSKLRAEVGYFVREVQRVKALLVSHSTPASASKEDTFSPEFAGTKKAFVASAPVEALATHGLIVGALAAKLEALALKPHNDRNRDLYLGPGTAPTHLFEVKTDVTPYSIYTGVGQLMVHGGTQNGRPRRVLVLPGTLSAALENRLRSLDVRLLTYEWKGNKPVVKGVKQVLS